MLCPCYNLGTTHLYDFDLPEQLRVTPIALQFVARCNAGWNDDIQSLHIYTDGSSDKARSASGFAMAVFGWNPYCECDQHTLVGWTGSHGITDSLHGQFVGAVGHSVSDAEAAAIIWSLLWLLQSGTMLHTTIHFDAQNIGFGAIGNWNIDEHSNIQRKLRELVQFVTQLRGAGRTSFEHVKAHSSHPCNDFVDCCAKHFQEGHGVSSAEAPSWQPVFLVENTTLAWAWWWVGSLRGDCGLPPLEQEGHKWAAKGLEVTSHGVSTIEDSGSGKVQTQTLDCRMATFNVMTLRNGRTENGESGEDWKAALIRSQFEELGVHVIGLQETRASQSCVISTANFTRYISAGSGGHHGCELWFSTVTPLVEGVAGSSFSPQEAVVVEQSPRSIMVMCKIFGCSILFASLHAPHEQSDQEAKDLWWRSIESHLRKAGNTCLLCLMGDFNARLGEADGEIVGERTCPITNDNGMRLYTLAGSLSVGPCNIRTCPFWT